MKNALLHARRYKRLDMRVPEEALQELDKLSQERKNNGLRHHSRTDIVLIALEHYFTKDL